MKRYAFLLAILLIAVSFLFSSCRPPELEGAIVHLNAGRDDQAFELAQEATQKYPDNAEAWYLLGRIQGKRGMAKDMIDSYDKSLAIGPTYQNDIEIEKASYFGKYYNDAVAAYNAFLKMEDREGEAAKKKLNEVIDNFQKALLIKPDYMAHRLIAISYQNLGDDANNLKALETAAETKPDTVLSWIELGYYFSRNKEYDKAAGYFKKGLEVDSNDVECLTLYAQNLDFADKQDEAIAAYKNALSKNPEEKAIPFNLGLLLNKQANSIEDKAKKDAKMEEAVIYFNKAYDLDPDLKETYDILSTLLLQLERYDDAERILDEGVKRFPDSASMWQNLSFLHAKMGNKEKAEEYYEKSQQLREN